MSGVTRSQTLPVRFESSLRPYVNAAVPLLISLILGCGGVHETARGYFNEPLPQSAEGAQDSAAFLASTRVPWCVHRRHPNLTLESMRAFRKAFYEAYSPEGAGSGERPTCWVAARAADPSLGIEEHDHGLLALALPGGGSRAAVFAAAVMLEMQVQGIVRRMDLVSSVSGGSLAAGLFARSCDDLEQCRALYGDAEPIIWRRANEERIFALLGQNFIGEAGARMTLPWNIVWGRLTHYSRTDILAEVFASDLFYGPSDSGGHGITFRQLNPQRPNWLISSLNITGAYLDRGLRGQQFLFTVENFEQELHSDLHSYPVALGVTASNALPGLFFPVSVADYSPPVEAPRTVEGSGHADGGPHSYKHLVDGGIYDRLGGEAIRTVLQDVVARERPCVPALSTTVDLDDRDCLDRVHVAVMDGSLPVSGTDPTQVSTRTPVVEFIVSDDFTHAPFVMLDIQAELRLESLKAFAREQNELYRRKYGREEYVFRVIEIRLRDVEECVKRPRACAEVEGLHNWPNKDLEQMYREFWDQVMAVPLSLSISAEDAEVIRRAAKIVLRRELQ